MKDYNELKKQYPEYISLDQLYKICKIAKRTALYLIKNKIIPSIDTGRKTWRYKIAISDVIIYLYQRDRMGSRIPRGAVTSRKHSKKHKPFAWVVTEGQEKQVAEYFNYIYADCDDILDAKTIADMTGLNVSTVVKMLQTGEIKSLTNHPKYLVPKQYLMDFVVTRRFLDARTTSELFRKIIGGFELWQNVKLSQ